MSDESAGGTGRTWDHEDCPRDDCDGELQQQDRFNVMCLCCENVWSHIKTETKHYLQTEDFETVAEKPIAVTDGGSEQLRDRLPDEVFAAKADFVKVSMKRMTARRTVGWLREYADYAEVSGADKSAEHARHVANALADELPEEEVEEYTVDTDTDQ